MSLTSKLLEIRRLPATLQILLACCALCLLSVLVLFITNPYAIAPEAALRLEMAKLLLKGFLPYRDFIDADPPAMMFLAIIPAFISATCHLDLVYTSLFCTFALTVASVAASIYIVSKSELAENPFAVGCFAVACAAISNLFIFQFGEREHLLVVLTLPYILARWLRSTSQTSSSIELPRLLTISSGLFAGLGFWLNLQYLLIPLLIEGAFVAQNNKFASIRKPEFAACLAGLSIVPIYLLLHKSVCSTYCNLIVPLWFNNFTFPMDDHVKYLDCSPDLRYYFYVAALVYIATLALRKQTSFFYPMTMLSLLGCILFITDKRGATGQLVLFVAPLLLNLSVIVAVAANNISGLSNLKLRRAASIVGLFVFAVGFGRWAFWAYPTAAWLKPSATKYDPILCGQPSEFSIWLNKFTKPGDNVLFLNDTVSPAYPLTVLSGRNSCPPFLWGYPIRLLGDCHVADPDPPVELEGSPQQVFDKTYVADQLLNIIQNKVPKVIFLQQGRTEDYLRKHQAINRALVKNYKPMGEANQIKLQKTEPAFVSGCWYSFTIWLREES